jgi:hypothetical protein
MKKYIIIAGILFLAAGCRQAVQTENKSNKPEEIKNTQNLPQGEKEGWQTYNNSQYGFEIKYSKDFELFTDVNKVKSLSYIPVCDENMAGCLAYFKDKEPNTNFEGAGVSLNIFSNLNSQSKCETMEGAKGVEIMVSGEKFSRFGNSGAAAGHFEEFQANRIFKNYTCFEVRLRMTSANIGNYPEGSNIKEFNSKEVWGKLEQVLSTFKFPALSEKGTIEGSLGYPSEGIPPEMKICAENILSKELFCTKTHIKNKKYQYGEGYTLTVPVGTYVVFSSLDSFNENNGSEYRAYYSEFVTCGISVECKSHDPIEITVLANRTLSKVDPQDWYKP